MNVLVTGGAGFIGSNFVTAPSAAARLAGHRHRRPRPTPATGPTWRRWPTVDFVEGNIADAALVDRLVADADVVVHFAAESHNDNSLARPVAVRRVERDRHVPRLLEAVRNHGKRLHHVSTDEVYGDLELDDPARFTESTPVQPVEPLLGHQGVGRPAGAGVDPLVRACAATLSNCSNNYGPYQHVEKFIPRQITNILSACKPKLYGTGANVRDWIHVDDHNDAVITIIERGRVGETYLIGADGERNNRRSSSRCWRSWASRPTGSRWCRDRPGHDLRYAIDSSKLRAETDWVPRYEDIRAGLEQTVGLVHRDNPGWWQRDKERTGGGLRPAGALGRWGPWGQPCAWPLAAWRTRFVIIGGGPARQRGGQLPSPARAPRSR